MAQGEDNSYKDGSEQQPTRSANIATNEEHKDNQNGKSWYMTNKRGKGMNKS